MTTKEEWVRRKERYGKSGSKNPEKTKERMSKSQMGHLTSEETKRKIGLANSISLKGNIPWNKNKTNVYSKETKQKMRLRKLGTSLLEEHKMKIGKSNKGKHSMKRTEEWIKNLSESHKGYIMKEKTKAKIKKYWNKPEMKEYARLRRMKIKIPTKFTSIELRIKSFLDELHIPYKTHKAVMGITQPDFFIEPNICIYCDGDYWHNLPIALERDKKINDILKFGGYKVIRIWEHEIKVMEVNDLKNKLK